MKIVFIKFTFTKRLVTTPVIIEDIFNNSSEIYTFIPTAINYLLMLIIGPGFKTFNLGSIV